MGRWNISVIFTGSITRHNVSAAIRARNNGPGIFGEITSIIFDPLQIAIRAETKYYNFRKERELFCVDLWNITIIISSRTSCYYETSAILANTYGMGFITSISSKGLYPLFFTVKIYLHYCHIKLSTSSGNIT